MGTKCSDAKIFDGAHVYMNLKPEEKDNTSVFGRRRTYPGCT